MEAIFGHGLVDSGAAAAQIGNLTYALGPDVSRGQDLSQSKLALPAGVGRDLVKQIMADDFVVFDSFDNAMFTVSGSQVFEAAAVVPQQLMRQVAALRPVVPYRASQKNS